MLKAYKKAYLNTQKDLYPSDFVNLVQIENNHIDFPKRTTFLSEDIKVKLKEDVLLEHEHVIYISHIDGVYALIALVDLTAHVKKHEFVIPDVVQGMVLNYQHYNAEAAPVSLISAERLDFKALVENHTATLVQTFHQGEVYVYCAQDADALLSSIGPLKEFYLADGHHRFLASQHMVNKAYVSAMITNLEDMDLSSIDRSMLPKEAFEISIDYLKSEGMEAIEGPLRPGVVQIDYQDHSSFYKLHNMEMDIFGNHDVYRLHTQVISQGFKEYDSTQLNYNKTQNNEICFKTHPMLKEQFLYYSDRGVMLPPKSTSFNPKCPSMLVMNFIE